MAPAAGAQTPAPEAVVRCQGVSEIYADVRNFPASETFNFYIAFLEEDGDFDFNGTFTTASTGRALVGGTSFPADYLPRVFFVAYRDANGNMRWDEDVDDTVYQGTGTITACPQSIVLGPK
jgi:hypothetical protein